MPTYTHVGGAALGDIISSPDLYVEASHKGKKGIEPELLTYVCG